MARCLLDNGAHVCCGRTNPLIAAVRYGHYGCARLLLEHHADPNCQNLRGYTPISIALQKHDGTFDSILLILSLLEYGAIPSTSFSDDISVNLLNFATERQSLYTPNKFAKPVEKAIHHNFIDLTSKTTFLAAFRFAFKCGSAELAEKILLSDSHSQIEELCPEAVYYSAQNNWPNILSKLLEKGVDVNVLTEGNTPLCAAAWREGHENYVVRLLLDNGADPNVTTDFGVTALHIAVAGFDDTSTAEMLSSAGANVNALNSESASPLLIACEGCEKKTEIVKLLLSHGADPNIGILGVEAYYPIDSACRKGHHDIVKLLLEYNADVNVRDENGKSALHSDTESATSQSTDNDTESASAPWHSAPWHLAPLYEVVAHLALTPREEINSVIELLQLMVKKHGAKLHDSPLRLEDSISYDFIFSEMLDTFTLTDLATFDGEHDFIVDLFRSGAGFQLLTYCCYAVATIPVGVKSTRLCKAAVLAGYVPSDEELQQLQLEGHRIQQLVNWLDEDRQQVPSLLRQCRVVIRRQLSAVVQFRSILPAIDKLPLPTNLKLYVQFDGPLTEVDLNTFMPTHP